MPVRESVSERKDEKFDPPPNLECLKKKKASAISLSFQKQFICLYSSDEAIWLQEKAAGSQVRFKCYLYKQKNNKAEVVVLEYHKNQYSWQKNV